MDNTMTSGPYVYVLRCYKLRKQSAVKSQQTIKVSSDTVVVTLQFVTNNLFYV